MKQGEEGFYLVETYLADVYDVGDIIDDAFMHMYKRGGDFFYGKDISWIENQTNNEFGCGIVGMFFYNRQTVGERIPIIRGTSHSDGVNYTKLRDIEIKEFDHASK